MTSMLSKIIFGPTKLMSRLFFIFDKCCSIIDHDTLLKLNVDVDVEDVGVKCEHSGQAENVVEFEYAGILPFISLMFSTH